MPKEKRTDFKFNFLKEVIVRMDFQGVFEPEMESLLPLIKPYLKEKGFSKYTKRTNNEIKIKVGNVEAQGPELNGVQSHVIHSFLNENEGYVLDVSNGFVCLTVSATAYAPFEDYSLFVSDIVDIYRQKIDFFSIIRVGVRKINVCMIKDKTYIKELFKTEYFGYFDICENADIDTIASNRKDVFRIENYKGNLLRRIEQGKVNGDTAYKLSLDIDIYIDDKAINEESFDLSKMNELIFEIYVDSMTEDFKRKLCGDDVNEFPMIIGVEENE